MLHLSTHWLCVRGRYNFVNIARCSSSDESYYRDYFADDFPWLDFNLALVSRYLSKFRMLALDPTYLSKSGKHTEGAGRFWSGCAQQMKWGMEFTGIAAVDLSDKTALHLLAVQTSEKAEEETLLDYYASIVELNAERLRRVSSYLGVDAYVSRKPMVDSVLGCDMHLVTRLWIDQVLRYFYHGPRRRGSERPKKYDGRVKPRDLRPDVFTPCAQDQNGKWMAYEAVVQVKAWKRAARVVIVHDYDQPGNIKAHRIYVSSDEHLDGGELLHMYQSRFQQEFLYRDAKQELGLDHAQAYSYEKNDFHVNAALTILSLAKAAHPLRDQPGEYKDTPFSIADVKTEYLNENQALRIIRGCGLDPNQPKIGQLVEQFKQYGKRRA